MANIICQSGQKSSFYKISNGMNPLIITYIAFGSFFSGFFLAWYTIRSIYQSREHAALNPKTTDLIQVASKRQYESNVDLIDSSPEIVNISNLPLDTLDRYIESITQKNASLASERMRRSDEPTLKIIKPQKEVRINI